MAQEITNAYQEKLQGNTRSCSFGNN